MLGEIILLGYIPLKIFRKLRKILIKVKNNSMRISGTRTKDKSIELIKPKLFQKKTIFLIQDLIIGSLFHKT